MSESSPPRHRAPLVRRDEVGGGLALLTFAPPRELVATHVMPGQYIEISIAGFDGFFVLANDVGADAWQIILRAGGDAADALFAATIGSEVLVTPAMGNGFPCDEARGRLLVIAVAGTGIAAARSIVAWRVREGEATRTELYIGMRLARDVALVDEMAAWVKLGVRCTLCLSREDLNGSAHAGIAAARGYVQDVVRARSHTESIGMIFAVGPDAMIAGMRALASAIGVRESDVRTNY